MKKLYTKFGISYFITILFAITAIIYFSIGHGSVNLLIAQIQHREQTIARSGASSIRSLLTSSADTLNVLAKNDKITSPNSQTHLLLNQVVTNWKGTSLSLIALIDSQGNVVAATSNQDTVSNLTAKSSGREYFENGKKLLENSFYVGKPILPKLAGLQSKYLIPISVPVYKDGKANGILVATFYVSDIVHEYLVPLKISDKSDIIIFNQQGDFISSLRPEVIGLNVFEYIKQNPFLGDTIVMRRLEEGLKQNIEQKHDLVIPNLFNNKLTRTLIASSPINIGDNKWILVVTTPVDDALNFIGPFEMRNLMYIIIIFFIVIFITLFLSKRFFKK
ncbi:MAG: cache domain-containing protein [Candidatus Shapirobacteria bacterium]